MQYRTDIKNGNALSVLGLGCMRLPRDFDKAYKIVTDAVEQGINYLDTAYLYPGSEAQLGEILAKSGLREKVFIATKLPARKCRTSEDFDRFFDEQLRRLRTGFIDYYLVHNISGGTMWRELCEMGLDRWIHAKKMSGAIGGIGFSFHGPQRGFTELLDAFDWDFCQIQYNYLGENEQAGRTGLQRAHELGLPVIIMEPLLGGKLATGLPSKAVTQFRTADKERTPAGWGLRWLLDQPEVTVILSGMNAPGQVRENIQTVTASSAGCLTEAEREVYPKVVKTVRESYKVPCTGCNYCMPCPHGVNIPGCFAAYNTRRAMGLVPGYTQYLTVTGVSRSSSGRACKLCGVCEKKCPQGIRIMSELKTVTKRMEPLWTRPLFKIIAKFTG